MARFPQIKPLGSAATRLCSGICRRGGREKKDKGNWAFLKWKGNARPKSIITFQLLCEISGGSVSESEVFCMVFA